MASRVDEILLQLEQVDYKTSPTDSISMPRKSVSRSRDEINMRRSLTNLLSSQCLQDNNLSSEMQDLQLQLKVITVQKKKEKINMCKQSDKIDLQVGKHKEDLQKIEKQLSTLEAKAETVEKIIKEKQDEKLEAFRYALKPLEDTESTILEEKVSLQAKEQALHVRMNEIEALRSSKSEDLKSLLAQRSEYIQNREKLQKSLSEIKQKDPCNYREYIQEIETREIVAAIKNKKTRQTSALKELEKKIAEVELEIEKSLENSKSRHRTDSFIPITIEKELEDLESYLNILCRDLKTPLLSSFVLEQCRKKGYFIEEVLLAEQISQVEDKEMQMIEDWKEQKELMESRIVEMRRTTEEHEAEIYAMMSKDCISPELENGLEEMKRALENMRKEAERAHRKHKAKMSALAKWKTTSQSKLTSKSNQKLPEDIEIIKLFKRELQKNIPKLDQWKNIENVINRYLDKLVERNNNYQEIVLQESVKVESQNKQNLVLKELQALKTNLLAERDGLHKDFLKVITLEKAAVKKFENAKVEIEIERNKFIEQLTDKNLNQNKSGLLQIQKTYGDKAIKKIRDKELQSAKESQEKLREGVKKKLESLSSDISHWESLIAKTESIINEAIKPEVFSIDQETVRIKEDLSVVSQQLSIIEEAESEVSAKLEYLMESKKRDINRSLHRTLELHGGDVDTKKLYRFTLIRDKKESAISQLLEEKKKIENEYSEKIKNVELEEIRVKSKIVQIQESIESAKKVKKQLEIAAKELAKEKDLENDEEELFIAEASASESESEEIIESEPTPEDTNNQEEIKSENDSLDLSEVPSQAESLCFFDLEDTTAQEQQFFQSILPLLEGATLFKKISQRNSLQMAEYDPLESDSPEAFGYCIRNFRLIKSLMKIEIRHLNKPGVESSILVEHLLPPIIPKHTAEMIKAQKKNWLNSNQELVITPQINKKYSDMKKSGLMNYSDPAFKLKSKEANNYPFFITLEKGGRLEVIATGYSIFKQWIDGINNLIKFKKQLARLKYKIN